MSSVDRLPGRAWHAARPYLRDAAVFVLEVATTARAAATMVVVEVLVRRMPLPRLGRVLGCRVDVVSSPAVAGPMAHWELPRRARRRLRCTHRVAGVWPLSDGPCLRRTLVGGHLVRELNPSVRLGLTGTGGDLSAHAWLEVDGRPLEVLDPYTPFGQIARQNSS